MPTTWYAIHLPENHRGVYNEWADVQSLIMGKESTWMHKSFGTRQEASFWSIKGRDLPFKPQSASTQISNVPRQRLEPLPYSQWQQKSLAQTREMTEDNCNTGNITAPILDPSKSGQKSLSGHGLQPDFAKFFAVAVGRIPGIYEAWEGERGAKEQVHLLHNAKFQGFDRLRMAVNYMHRHGVPECHLRLFRKHFAERPDFKPDPYASFNDQFSQLASSQNLTPPQIRTARVAAIRDELISHYLPGGLPIAQISKRDRINLTPQQTLQIYQAMCRHAGKLVGKTIKGCLLSLKQRPFVNIIDLIDACRTKQEPDTYDNWTSFKNYTLKNENRIHLGEAKKNEFLAALLQRLNRPPPCVDLRSTEYAFLSDNESNTPPYRLDERVETPDRTVNGEIKSSLPMLSPSQLSPMLKPEPASPLPELSDFEDDLKIPTLDMTENSEPAVYIKIKPPSLFSSAQSQPRIVSSGIKRGCSILTESHDLVSERPKKRSRQQS